MATSSVPHTRELTELATASEPRTNSIRQALATDASGIAESLRKWFGVEFSIVDGETGELVYAAEDQPAADWDVRTDLCRAVSRSRQSELIVEDGPLAVMAMPLVDTDDAVCVAVSTFVCRRSEAQRDLDSAATVLGLTAEDARQWMARQPLWPEDALLRTGELARRQWLAERQVTTLQNEVEELSLHLSVTYEEISLLHRLTDHLKVSGRDENLGRVALEWLAEVLPAESFVLQYLAASETHDTPTEARTQHVTLTQGSCPVNEERFAWLLERLGLEGRHQPLVVNPPHTQGSGWRFPDVRQLIIVPVAEGENVFGWLAAFNHTQGRDFGTDAASLMASVAAILGIHSGNTQRYRDQAEVLAGVVRALASAIDAKDPYTCGHSERTARVAVRLAQELGCDGHQLRVVYFGGLLHDIGKIGVDDQVLRKPCRLNEAELQHVRSHTEIGCRILRGLKKLDEVLPVVRHHHENWDGTGYPSRLAGIEIPFVARVIAVADAFDAMSSDRPYRPGLSEEKLDAILREGAGQQWDPLVVAAFFRARADIRAIVQEQRENLGIDAYEWT